MRNETVGRSSLVASRKCKTTKAALLSDTSILHLSNTGRLLLIRAPLKVTTRIGLCSFRWYFKLVSLTAFNAPPQFICDLFGALWTLAKRSFGTASFVGYPPSWILAGVKCRPTHESGLQRSPQPRPLETERPFFLRFLLGQGESVTKECQSFF